MSRIIVKNLPLKANEQEIRSHFGGDITDVKLLRKRDGTSRKFAFIGFKTDAAAQHAANYYNKSFMATSQLSVEVAKDMHDETLVSSRDRKRARPPQQTEPEFGNKLQKTEQNAQLDEFLNVMKPQSTTAMWKNADDIVQAKVPIAEDEDEDVVDLPSLNKNKPQVEEEQPQQPDEMDTDEELEKMRQDTNDEPQAVDENMTDLDWLKSKRVRIKDGEVVKSKPQAPAVAEPEPQPTDDLEEPAEPPSHTEILASGRLFLRNLAYSTTEPELVELFSRFGQCTVHLPVDPKSDKSKGIAFVLFPNPSNALEAFQALDGTTFQGRLLHILAAKPTQKFELDEFDLKNMPLKKQQLLKRKANAAKQQFSWNSLYLNRDAVLETAAKKLGITKAEMMDPHSSNMAVKAALAESSVLESVQSYFKSKGVDLAKLDTKDVTDSIILVKNIPFGCTLEELSDLFGVHGELVRVLMPPDGGIAIVQYTAQSSGRAAFSKLAFRRLGNSILYLQKAPKGLLDETSSEKVQLTEKQVATSAQDLLDLSNKNDTQVSSAVHVSVFIKNLNFSTTSVELSRLFKKSPGFVTASVKTKPGKVEGTTQSMGYGFAEFDTLEHAETAIKAFQGFKLDNHALQLKTSTRGTEKPQKSSTTKIVIKNVPFETTRQDIYDLFGTFGQLRSLRLPRKFNKQTRGFAFAEFATLKEAETAMASLSGAHLLGRRLVMEYAEADAVDAEEEIARMEKKVQGQVDAERVAGLRSTGQHGAFDMDEDE